MAESGTIDNIVKVVQFIIKFVFKLTANLVIELLKFGALTLILLGVFCGSIVGFLCAIRWAYVTSDGNIIYTICVSLGMILAVLISLSIIQYVVKDLLKLTKMTILEFVFLWLKPIKKDKSNGAMEQKIDSSHSQTERKDL